MKKMVMVISCLILLASVGMVGMSCGDDDDEGGLTAKFDFTPETGIPPLEVQFTDQSEGDITSRAWDFDDDDITDSTELNPSFTYNEAGKYTISLTVSGPDGSDTETKTIKVGYDTEVTWTLATFAIPGDIFHDALLYFADEVYKNSLGRMEIKVSHTLFEGTAIFDAVSSGTADMGHVAGTWLGDKMPKYTAVYVQPWGNNIEERLFIQEYVLANCAPILEETQDNGVMTPFMLDAGMIQWMFDRTVEVKGDVTGLHLWSPGDVADYIIEAFGATPVPLDITGIYTAAQTGTIDGMAFMALDMYVNQKFYEVMPYVTLGGGIHFGAPVLMNIDSFEDLDEDLQAAVMDAALDAQENGITAKTSQFDTLVSTLEATSGVTVYPLPEAEVVHWLDETIYPLLQAALSMSLSPDEIAQVMTVKAEAEADLAGS